MRQFLLLLLLFPLQAIAQVQVGADQIDQILTHAEGKRVGMTVNHTSLLSDGHTHVVDTLIASGVKVIRLYSPEHGLRGQVDAGAKVSSGRDAKTGLPVVSLYGTHKKPSPKDLSGIDLMIFDMQDVGVRFYTYISTLTYVLEACAEQGIPLLVLDRPNPHDCIDGAVRKKHKYRSFISLLPIPTVHGLTLGEAAFMMNNEGWLRNNVRAKLSVITVKGWKHGEDYSLPVPPSPNLRTDRAILYYPTLCYFEATTWSEGRGTDAPFEQIGYPDKRIGDHTFTPIAMKGATSPKHKGMLCYGPTLQLREWHKGINLEVIIEAYQASKQYGIDFVNRKSTFNLLAGNGTLYQQIMAGLSAEEIRQSWAKDLDAYRALRAKYLLYPDY
ncbi:exo-beta-N-acetylmuramidase NamZ family protein [Porphyromonas levii]|uniref:exo-beta-N-acetylmuramidase NamZ family protein n=1 Tax=Porphyromonas levii TaxID=28114 RepID=UPI001B8CDCCD|nr:DUF1343 domain-containing protein [Porphyromonas levii]MBR8713155.1 hypothetical protein [Porphyromonas levii]MBR8714650.1 hypothetical protein [Porphyromonas levii]MBR8727686.1 hypothetical protein [Porphyromonas levii]MBR8729306.1 hypothetical protein [Porphyromonas levii]MBR8736064.1 hypothetical protein [Porphyromonas levii]